MLLGRGANPNDSERRGDSPLEDSAYYGHEEIFQRLLDKGADVTDRAVSGPVSQGRDKILRILLDKGAKVDLRWALDVSSSNRHEKVLQLLLDTYPSVYDADV